MEFGIRADYSFWLALIWGQCFMKTREAWVARLMIRSIIMRRQILGTI